MELAIIRKIEDMDYPEDMRVLILSLGCGIKPESLSHLVSISCNIHHVRHAPLCAKAIRFFMRRHVNQPQGGGEGESLSAWPIEGATQAPTNRRQGAA